jgi:hypothetical protein
MLPAHQQTTVNISQLIDYFQNYKLLSNSISHHVILRIFLYFHIGLLTEELREMLWRGLVRAWFLCNAL